MGNRFRPYTRQEQIPMNYHGFITWFLLPLNILILFVAIVLAGVNPELGISIRVMLLPVINLGVLGALLYGLVKCKSFGWYGILLMNTWKILANACELLVALNAYDRLMAVEMVVIHLLTGWYYYRRKCLFFPEPALDGASSSAGELSIAEEVNAQGAPVEAAREGEEAAEEEAAFEGEIPG